MAARSRVLVLLAVAVMAFAAPAGHAGTAPSPCPGDATLCAPTVGVISSCKSIEVYASSTPPVLIGASAAAISGAGTYDYHQGEAAHVPITLSTPPGSPVPASIAVSVTGLRTSCGAFIQESNGFKRGCAKTEVQSFFFGLNLPGTSMDVTIQGEEIVTEQCSTALGGPMAGTHAFRAGRLTINGAGQDIVGGLPTNQVLGGGAAFVAFNEDLQSTTGSCVQNQGDVLRVEAGGLRVILGWMSTNACA